MAAFPNKFNFYNKELKPKANANRNQATKAEACLWKYVLRGGEMKDYTFRRQRPVLDYIVDFMCQPLMLIIEIRERPIPLENDHFIPNSKHDVLVNSGFTILYFTNDEVLESINSVASCIEQWIVKFENENGIPEKALRVKEKRNK